MLCTGLVQTQNLWTPYVRNRVIEIRRFTDIMQWFHVESSGKPADIATRKGATLEDVGEFSDWIGGKPWMKLPLDELHGTVLKNLQLVKLKSEHFNEITKESIKLGSDLCNSDLHLLVQGNTVQDTVLTTTTSVIRERLQFSKYLIDPNRFRFRTVVRIVALVIKFAKIWISCIRRKIERFLPSSCGIDYPHIPDISDMAVETAPIESPVAEIGELSDADVQYALNYFFMKATEELRSYVHPKHYSNDVVEKDGILYFTGRVTSSDISLHGDDISAKMIDLSGKSFVVPIVDSESPLAFSILNEVHWYSKTAKHRGVETTIRATMTIAHILQVRKLAKRFRANCKRCRYLLLRTVEVVMGPTSGVNLCVAPPFYVTQCDLCGPFNSYSSHNKRATVKVWIFSALLPV